MENSLSAQVKTGKLFKDGREAEVEREVDYQMEKLQLNTKDIVTSIISEAELSKIKIDSVLVREKIRRFL